MSWKAPLQVWKAKASACGLPVLLGALTLRSSGSLAGALSGPFRIRQCKQRALLKSSGAKKQLGRTADCNCTLDIFRAQVWLSSLTSSSWLLFMSFSLIVSWLPISLSLIRYLPISPPRVTTSASLWHPQITEGHFPQWEAWQIKHGHLLLCD